MKTIISTIGTSIYTNLLKKDVQDEYKIKILTLDSFESYENGNSTALEYDDNLYNEIEKNIFNNWLQGIVLEDDVWEIKQNTSNTNCCAEIKTLYEIDNFRDYQHVLITTDTAISYSSAKLIKKFLIEKLNINDENVKIKPITGLQVHKPEKFKDEGINNLIEVIKKIKDNNKGDEIILNISGGYKALIPILTIIGQLENIPLKYIYEDSEELIEIGKLPINFDWGLTQLLKPFLNVKYHIIWKNGGEKLAKQLYSGEIEFKDSSFVSNKVGKKVLRENKNKLLIFKNIFDYNLINKKLEITLFGKLFQKISDLENYRGYEMEYIFYHYFSQNENYKSNLVNEYYTLPSCDFIGSFKYENDKIIVREQKGNGNSWIDIGDIDIPLKRKKVNVLGEAKSFSKLLDYIKEKEGEKYLKQLKARLELFCAKYPEKITLNENNEAEIEILFIVYQFQFNEYKTSIIEKKLVKDVFDKFKELNNYKLKTIINSDEVTVKPIFKLVGAKCIVELNANKMTANYTSFYQKPKFEFELYN